MVTPKYTRRPSDTSECAEEAGRIATALDGYAELFVHGAHPEPEVALVMNEDLFHFVEGSLHDFLQHYQYTVAGLWKSLWSEGFTPGFMEAAAIPPTPDKVKALILPFPLVLGPGVVQALATYVRNGGTVISEACPGRFSDHGMAFRGDTAPGVANSSAPQKQGSS